MVMPAAMVPRQSCVAMIYGTCLAVSHAFGFFKSPSPLSSASSVLGIVAATGAQCMHLRKALSLHNSKKSALLDRTCQS